MSLTISSKTKYVAIPSTYWGENCIKKEPWFDRRFSVYYHGEVVERKYFIFEDKYKLKIFLSATKHYLYLTEQEVENYNLSKIPQNAEVLEKKDDESEEDTESEDESLIKKYPQPKKKTKLITSLACRYYIVVFLFI